MTAMFVVYGVAGGLSAAIFTDFMLFDGRLYLPWQMIFYLTVGFAGMVVVSLFTRRVDEAKLDQFYSCLRTPVQPGEPEMEPFTLPEGTPPAPRAVLFDHPSFEIPRPTRVSIIGFLAGWGAVGLLIAVFYLILSV